MKRQKAECQIPKIRKHKRQDPFEDNRSLRRVAKSSSKIATEALLNAGISIVYVKNGQLVQKTPDRKIEVLGGCAQGEPFDLRGYLCQESG
jgi:hypothetical protein